MFSPILLHFGTILAPKSRKSAGWREVKNHLVFYCVFSFFFFFAILEPFWDYVFVPLGLVFAAKSVSGSPLGHLGPILVFLYRSGVPFCSFSNPPFWSFRLLLWCPF